MTIKERPIIFSAPMVQAILAGKKQQTRRMLKHQPPANAHPFFIMCSSNQKDEEKWRFTETMDHTSRTVLGPIACPYGKPGDRLWVRETWARAQDFGYDTEYFHYQATYTNGGMFDDVHKWRSPLFMPRHASRITLEISSIKAERLQSISESDAIAEGCPLINPDPFIPGHGSSSASGWFSQIWEDINGPGSWDVNPWVWVVKFQHQKTA